MEYKLSAVRVLVTLMFIGTLLAIDGAKDDKKTCRDFKKREVQHGDVFKPFKDPCVQCRCDNGNQHACLSAMCAKPTCENFVRDPDNCCEYTCPTEPKSTREVNLVRKTIRKEVDRDGKTIRKEVDRDRKTIRKEVDRDRKTVRKEVDRDRKTVYTGVDKKRKVMDKKRKAMFKESVKDILATYRRQRKFAQKKGRGVDSKACVDEQGNTILPGQRYVSMQDPCVSCVCTEGRGIMCSAVMCALPTCTDWDPVPGKCCEYTCKANPPEALNSTVVIEGGQTGNSSAKPCKDHRGKLILEGQQFVSTPDPCIECVCVGGAPQKCMAVACAKPHCPYYVPKPDECCGYDCVDPIKPKPNDCEQYMVVFTEQAKYWLSTLKDEHGLWTKDILPAAVSAMQVTDPYWVSTTDINRLNVLKLHTLILSELSWSKEARSVPTQKLSDYVLAVKAVCQDPGSFYGHNLLTYLEKSMEKGLSKQDLYSLSGQVLTLCASGRNIKRKFTKKMKQLLNRNRYMLDLGASSMATLAYLCVQEQGQKVSRELRTTLHQTGQNFRPSDNHAALAVQALLIGGRSLDCRSVRAVATHLTNEIRSQNHNYTVGLGVHVAEMVPVLYDKTLLDIRDLCTAAPSKRPSNVYP